jgi:hypothetical protein
MGEFLMTIELASAASAEADSGFATTAIFLLEGAFSRRTALHLAGNGSDALRDNQRFRKNTAGSPV